MTEDAYAGLASSSLCAFTKYASNFQIPMHSRYLSNIIDNALKDMNDISKRHEKHKIIMVGGPPRHGKTELTCCHGSAWILGNFPTKRIIIAAYQSRLAEKHSRKARGLFKEHAPFLWGSYPSEDTFAGSDWETSLGGGVKSVGIESGASGFGADILLIDDYHKDSLSAESQLQRDNVWDWWESAALHRIHPGGFVVIYATRWHDDDLCGRLLKQEQELGEDCPFNIINIKLPAIAEENDILGRKPGEALWPWWKNESALNNIKNAIAPYVWSALFQANPVIRGGTLFKSDHFRYYEIDPRTYDFLCWRKDEEKPIRIKRKSITRHVYVDPAIEIKKTNDPTGMLAWGYCRTNRIWLLLDRINDRIEHRKVHEEILKFAFKNDCTEVGIENEKLGKVLVKQSEGKDSYGGKRIPFKEIPTGGLDKYARATPMANYCENERVFFPKNAHWLSEFETRLITFPNAAHDEDVDCTSMADRLEVKRTMLDIFSENK